MGGGNSKAKDKNAPQTTKPVAPTQATSTEQPSKPPNSVQLPNSPPIKQRKEVIEITADNLIELPDAEPVPKQVEKPTSKNTIGGGVTCPKKHPLQKLFSPPVNRPTDSDDAGWYFFSLFSFFFASFYFSFLFFYEFHYFALYLQVSL